MPTYTIQDDSGNTLTLEGDSPPTEQEMEELFASRSEPDQAQFPAGLSEELARRQEYEANLRAYTGGSPMSPGGPDMDFARALYQEVPAKIGEGIHAAMKPIEAVARPVFQALRNATAPTNYGMTGEFLPELKPNESILHGLEPSAEDLGIIPSLRRAAAGMTTPGGLALLPIAGGGGVLGKVVQGGFAAGAAAAIPPSLEAMIQADTAAGKRGAATDVALSALFAGTMGRGFLKERKPNALQPVAESSAKVFKARLTRSEAEAQGPQAVLDIMEKHGLSREEAVAAQADVRKMLGVSREVPSTKKDFVLDPTKVFEKRTAKEIPAEEARVREMSELQAARDNGTLKDPFDMARLDRLEKKYGIKGLSAEDARYVIQEREGLQGVKIGDKQVGIEVVETAPAPSPDAPFSPPGSSPFTINPKTGNVVIIADRMAADRAQMRRRGLSESQINEAYKSDIVEEVIHLGTDPKMALKYWENLSSAEKFINERRYNLGGPRNPNMTPTLLGMEAFRFRAQQAFRMKPTEFTQMAMAERWTWEAITALEKTIRFSREKFTNLGKEQRQMFDNALANLSAAKTAIQGGTPSSPRLESLEQDKEIFRKLSERRSELIKAGQFDTPEFTQLWKQMEEVKNRHGGMPPGQTSPARTPSSPRLGPTSKERRRKMVLESPERPYYSERLVNPELIDKSIPIVTDYGTLLAVPVGANRTIGTIGCAEILTKQEAMNAADILSSEPGFPDVRVRPVPRRAGSSFPDGWMVEWGDKIDWEKGWDPVYGPKESYHSRLGRQFGYKDHVQPGEVKEFLFLEPPRQRQLNISPASPRRGPMSKRGEDAAKLAAMRVAAAKEAAGEAPPPSEPRPAIDRGSPWEDITPAKAKEAVVAAIGELASGTGRDFRLASGTFTSGKTSSKMYQVARKPKRELFDAIVGKLEGRFGSLPKSKLQELAMQGLSEHLDTATGAEVGNILRRMNLVKRVVGGGKPGERTLSQIPDATAEPTLLNEFLVDLQAAVKRAKGAKNKETKYRLLLDKAKRAHQAIRDAGWRDVDESGKLVEQSLRERVKQGRIAHPGELAGEIRNLMNARTDLEAFVQRIVGPDVLEKKGYTETKKMTAQGPVTVLEEYVQKMSEPVPARPMFEPTAPTPGKSTGYRNLQRLREKAKGVILNEFQQQVEQTKKSVHRPEIEMDDLADPRTAKEPVFSDIRSSELGNPTMLGQRLTEDARVVGRNVEDSRRLVALLNKKTGAVDMVSIWDSGASRAGVVVKHPGISQARTPLETVMKTHRPLHSILVDEPVRYFRKSYKNLTEFNREFGNDARSAATREYDLPMEGSESDLTTSGGTTGRRAIPGEFVQSEGAIRPSGSMAGPMAGATRMEMGIDPGEIGEGARLQNSEAGLSYDYALASKKEWLSPDDFNKVIGDLEADAANLSITKQSTPVVNALNKMFNSILERPDMTPGLALEKLAVEFYENINNATKEQFVQRTLGRYGGEIPEAGGAGESVGLAAREPATGERTTTIIPGGSERTVAPGTLPTSPEFYEAGQLDARSRDVFRGAYQERVAREVRQPRPATAPEPPFDPARSQSIRDEAILSPEEARFDQLVKNMGEMQRQVDAEIAAEPPEQVTPSSPRRKVFKEIEHDIDVAEAELVNQFIVGPGKSFAEWYSGWLTQNIRRNGGVRAGQAADIGNIVIDRTKKIYGELSTTLNPAIVLAGGTKEFPLFQQLPTRGQLRTTMWLNRLSHPASMDTAVSRTVGAIEGDFIVPRFAQETVNASKAANLEIGGLILEHPQGKFQRNMTAWGYDIMIQGGPEFEIILRDTAKLNSTVENFGEVSEGMRVMWQKWREENLKSTPDINELEKINQDFIRQWPNVVTHVKTQFGYQQVIHTDLHNYLKNSALRTSHVAAFREQFPNTTEGKARLAVLDKDVRNELKDKGSKDWDSLIKTMQGKPTDTYNRFGPLAPGKAWSEFTRALNDTAVSTARRMVLTGQMVTQGPETVVAPFVYFSPKNVIQSAIRFRELWPLMEKTGQINKLTYDFSIDPANPIRSAFRFGGNLLSKMYLEHFLNEFQGKWFAANATVAVERMRSGKMSAREMRDLKETFRQTGFTGEQATRMMEGDAELLGQFQRRMPAWAVGENRLLAEGSRLGANRLFNSIFRFQMYPMLKMNQFKMAMGRVIEANETGTKSERFATRKRLVEVTFGTALQGAMLAVVAAYFFGGREGLKMKAMQAVDDPVDFMIESLLGAMSGPLYMVWSGARYGGLMGIGEQATRLAFPFSVGANLIEASAGVGQYKDMDAWDRIGKFLSQKTPGFRIMRTMLAEWALGEENPKLEANLKALSQWKRDVWKNKKFPEGSEHNRAFRIQMKKAVEAMIAEDMEARQKALDKALEIKINQGLAMRDAEQDVAASFQGRTVLKNPETNKALTGDEKDALIKRIGQDAFKRLEWFDNMLKDAGKNPSSVE